MLKPIKKEKVYPILFVNHTFDKLSERDIEKKVNKIREAPKSKTKKKIIKNESENESNFQKYQSEFSLNTPKYVKNIYNIPIKFPEINSNENENQMQLEEEKININRNSFLFENIVEDEMIQSSLYDPPNFSSFSFSPQNFETQSGFGSFSFSPHKFQQDNLNPQNFIQNDEEFTDFFKPNESKKKNDCSSSSSPSTNVYVNNLPEIIDKDSPDLLIDPEQLQNISILLDSFITLFETRAPVNNDIDINPILFYPHWHLLTHKIHSKDQLSFVLKNLENKISNLTIAFVDLIVLFQNTTILLCGCACINWLPIEYTLASQAERILKVIQNHFFLFEVESFQPVVVRRLIDGLILLAVYFKDKKSFQKMIQIFNTAFENLVKYSSIIPQEVFDRFHVSILYSVPSSEDINYWHPKLTSSFESSKMVEMIRYQAAAFSSTLSNQNNFEQFIYAWNLLDQSENFLSECQNLSRSKVFIQIRQAIIYSIRTEILFRIGKIEDSTLWILKIREIAIKYPILRFFFLKILLGSHVQDGFKQDTPHRFMSAQLMTDNLKDLEISNITEKLTIPYWNG